SVRHQALFRMRAPREAVVIPEEFYKLIERLPRDVSEVQHDRKSVLLLRASPCRSTQHNSKTMPRECGAKSKNLLSGRLGFRRLSRLYQDVPPARAFVHELDGAGHFGEQSVILAAADVYARLDASAALANDDRPAGNQLTA